MAEFINATDSLNTGRNKINRSIQQSERAEDKSDKAIKDSGEALTTSQSVRDEFNQVVIDGDSSVESAQARVGADGTIYPVLKERLDGEQEKVAEQLAQKGSLNRQKQGSSFVDKTQLLNTIRNISLIPEPDGFAVEVLLNNTEKGGFAYTFRENADGLVLLRSIEGGQYTEPSDVGVELVGTYVETGHVAYTVTPEDYFHFTFTGTGCDFRTLTGYRSGVWEFTSNTGGNKRIDLYTTNRTDNTATFNLYKDLPYGTHKVTGVFKGKSPHSDDEITPRGWIAGQIGSRIIVHSSYRPLTDRVVLSGSTINDFAITMKKSGSSDSSTWTPVHSGITGVSANAVMKLYIDGLLAVEKVEYLRTNYEIKKISMTQRFLGRNGNSTEDLTQHTIQHTIDDNGMLSINNTVRFIKDTLIGNGYLTMLGVIKDNFTHLYLNDKSMMTITGNEEPNYVLDEQVTSVAYVGEYQAGRYYGVSIDTLNTSDAMGLHYKPDETPGLITFRPDGVSKFYIKVVKTGSEVEAGTIFSNVSRILPTYGVMYPDSSLSSIM